MPARDDLEARLGQVNEHKSGVLLFGGAQQSRPDGPALPHPTATAAINTQQAILTICNNGTPVAPTMQKTK